MGLSISDSILGWLSCVQQKETRVSLELQDRKTSLEAGTDHWKGTTSRQRLDDHLHVLYPVPCAHSLSFVLGVHFLFFSSSEARVSLAFSVHLTAVSNMTAQIKLYMSTPRRGPTDNCRGL